MLSSNATDVKVLQNSGYVVSEEVGQLSELSILVGKKRMRQTCSFRVTKKKVKAKAGIQAFILSQSDSYVFRDRFYWGNPNGLRNRCSVRCADHLLKVNT